jgi:thiamine biosynthesis lipoprotein
MGTVVSFDVPSSAQEDGSLAAAVGWLHWVDEVFSTYRADSEVSRLGRGEVTAVGCAPRVAEVLAACEELREQSGGYFSACPAGTLDPSGYVKGWAVERAARIIAEAGSTAHTVNGGGDVQCVGARPDGTSWRIGISSPLQPGALALIVAGRDFAVATSGIAERGAHIMDPVAGRAATGLASVTVVGPSLTLADAYATAAFAMGPSRARQWTQDAIDGYDACAILPDGSTWQTSGFRSYLPAA